MDADKMPRIVLCGSCANKFGGLAARLVSVGLVRMGECKECGRIKPVQEFEIRKRRTK